MTKTIDSLVPDIHKVFTDFHNFNEDLLKKFGERVSATVARQVNQESGTPSLRMSNLGQKCNRKLWYSINTPNDGEHLPVEARVKFLFGHLLEDLLLFLAEEAGHDVRGCQDELLINGVKGHRDAVIDGVVVDCKSASSFSFKKFKEGLKHEDDGFGYLDQLQAYLYASQDDPVVTDKGRAAFLVIDKTLGHITLDIHKKTDKDFPKIVAEKREAVTQEKPPARFYKDIPEGKSGNRKLGIECSYCNFKSKCWPSLKTYVYARGPVYLTNVERTPDVPEAKGYIF